MGTAQLAFVLLVLVGVLLACRPRPVFVIQIRDGVVRVRRGPVPREFVGEVGDVCQKYRVVAGTIRGFLVRKRIALVFSRHIPPPCQQRIRNIWNLHF
ncbi:MAG: DUF3634 family protein [Planctomycetes bacterium]|nr:DUF3634 family protein [Planctomycetota bacterium]